jgi:hypothetical protein
MDTPTRFINQQDWEPQAGRQTYALERLEDELMVGGARGPGKTELGLAWGCEPEYINHPQFTGLVIRKDYEDLSDWIERARYFYHGIGQIIGKPAEIRWRAGGVTRLGHWKDKNTIARYIGHEYQKMNIEELTQSIATKDEYISLMGSLRSTIPGLKAQLYASTNPGGIGHRWVKEYFVDMAKDKPYRDPITGRWRLFIPMTIEDNPKLTKLDPSYYAWLKGLPEPLHSAWYKGSWDLFVGQFFPEFGTHMRTEPWHIGNRAALRLYGSIDIGIGHNTSFGLWYKADDGHIERLCSYLGNGFYHGYHAKAIFEKIESFSEYVGGNFPLTIWIGHDANRRERLGEGEVRAPIDEYREVFKDKATQFVVVNPNKRHGCALMHRVFAGDEGVPILQYWKSYNESFEIGINNALMDPNDPDIYLKTQKVVPELKSKTDVFNQNKQSAVEDAADEAMYGICGLYTDIANEKQKRQAGLQNKVIPMNNSAYFNHNYGHYMKDTALA